MGRPTTISDDKILSAAREVFLEHGIAATTAQVARKARVAEGSIFKRWKTKQELFFTALTPDLGDPPVLRSLPDRVGKGEVTQTMFDLAVEAIGFFKRMMPLVMMTWSNPSTNGLPPHLSVTNPRPIQSLRKLARYFEAEMDAGRINRCDAEVVARMFMGCVQNFTFLEMLNRTRTEMPMPAEMYVRSFVDLIWNGLRPERRRAKEKAR